MKGGFFIWLVLLPAFCFAQLFINELSNGAPGSTKEYVEFLVVGTRTCNDSCHDIRGWIFDDNNGWYATGTGTGIALGCLRFSFDPQWQCVPFGSIIVAYKENDVNPALPPDDETDVNGDGVFVLPGNSLFFERNNSIPNSSVSDYTGLSFVDPPLWFSVIMRNTGDSFHTVDPNNVGSPFHVISWGNNNSFNTQIYFNMGFSGRVAFMQHTVNNDLYNQGNWTLDVIAGNESPGQPNNVANAAWINSMKGIFPSGTWTWNGSLSPDWFEPCNWDRRAVPDTSANVVIPGNTPFQPTIAMDTAYCNTATINVDNNGHLTIDWQGGGILITQP